MYRAIISLVLMLGLALSANAAKITLKADAPSQYQVVQGDTLWHIAGRYLHQPWQWPQLWQMNRAQIKNPNLIYPGDVLQLSYVDGQPRLSLLRGQSGEVRLSPQIRSEALNQPISSIPSALIEPFLQRPLVVEAKSFAQAPSIVAGPDERIGLTIGDVAYTHGVDDAGVWQAYRLGKPLIDPVSKAVLGQEAIYSGDLQVEQLKGEVQTLRVKSIAGEVLVGDKLMRTPSTTPMNYVPHVSEQPLSGSIIAVYNGVSGAAQYSTVVLNLGQRQGVDVGQVLDIRKSGRSVTVNTSSGGKKALDLPAAVTGTALVYRVFDGLSYALILESRNAIYVGDGVATPEQE